MRLQQKRKGLASHLAFCPFQSARSLYFSQARDFVIQPSDAKPKLDASQWPLLLKVSRRRSLNVQNETTFSMYKIVQPPR